jgi:zinc and cadmium transporter
VSLLAWIVIFCLLGGLLSVLAAALFLLASASLRDHLLPHLVSFATGTLLAAALLGLLPHALAGVASTDMHVIPLALLLGLLGFFLLEKLVLWRHCHADHCEVHVPDQRDRRHSTGAMILIGDSLHNFLDGILIAGAFLTDIHLGVVTSLAVAAHEIPQEVGDFAVLLHSGYTRGRAFLYNILSSLATVLGGVMAWFALREMQELLPYLLAIAASSFIYIAVADLIPTLHQRVEGKAAIQQIILISIGVLLIYATHSTLH